MIYANSRAGIAEVVKPPKGQPLQDPPCAFEAALPWKTLPAQTPFMQAEVDALNQGIW